MLKDSEDIQETPETDASTESVEPQLSETGMRAMQGYSEADQPDTENIGADDSATQPSEPQTITAPPDPPADAAPPPAALQPSDTNVPPPEAPQPTDADTPPPDDPNWATIHAGDTPEKEKNKETEPQTIRQDEESWHSRGWKSGWQGALRNTLPDDTDCAKETLDADLSEEPLPRMDDSGVQSMQGVSDTQSLQEQQAIESLSQVEGIQPEVWQGLNETEQLSALQDVENRMAGLQGRPPAEVISQEAGRGEFGVYNPETNQIVIGSYSLQNDEVKEVVDTTVHEGRHAYQHYAMEHPGFHPNETEVEAWRDNMQPGNYLTAQEYGQELYQSQPVEADAWRYGRRIANGLYGGK